MAPSLVSSASFGPSDATVSTPVSTTSTAISNGKMQTTPFMHSNVSTIPVVTASMMNNRSSAMSASTDGAAEAILPLATKTEKFLLTAADQESGSRDERLNRVIRSKYEAGLLKPYNYVKGYARLSRWMDRKYDSYLFSLVIIFFHHHNTQRVTRVQTTDPSTFISPSTEIQSNSLSRQICRCI